MQSRRVIFGVSVILLCWLHFSLEAQPTFSNLAGNKNLRIAKFHSIWFFTGFSKDELSGNHNHLRGLAKAFNNDFIQLVPSVPTGFRVFPERYKASESPITEGGLKGTDVLAALDNVQSQVEADDVVFCYMLCHGKLVDGKPFLNFGKDDVPRRIQPGDKVRLAIDTLPLRLVAAALELM